MIGPVGISGHEIPRPLLRLLTSNALTIFWVSLASPWSTVCHILPDSALVRDRSYPQQGLKAWIRGESCLFIFAIYKHIHKLIKMHIHNIHVYIYTLHALNFVYIYIYNLYIYIYIYIRFAIYLQLVGCSFLSFMSVRLTSLQHPELAATLLSLPHTDSSRSCREEASRHVVIRHN